MGIFTWLIVGVIILGVIAYANPQLWEDVKWKVTEGKNVVVSKAESINTPGIIEPTKKADTLVSKCKRSFDDCKDISNKKMGVYISISEIEEVNNTDEAWNFYDIWFTRIERDNKRQEEKINKTGFPQVLIAYSFKWSNNDLQLPSVAVCNEKGELTQDSKGALSCG
ncbi:MAG: hypothetical protein V1831_01365 [Candidatus Woesearchaeota archaeon]